MVPTGQWLASDSYAQVIKYPYACLMETPEFRFETNLLQPVPGVLMTFVHIWVFTWNLSSLKNLKNLWLSNRHRLPNIVYAQGDVTDAKWEKFVRQLGFEPIADCLCTDGENRLIYVHYKR